MYVQLCSELMAPLVNMIKNHIFVMIKNQSALFNLLIFHSKSFYICWYLIESLIPCICPGPLAEKYAHKIKDPAIHLTVGMGYSLSLCAPNTPVGFAAFLKLQSCLKTEFAGVYFWTSEEIFLETLPNNMW